MSKYVKSQVPDIILTMLVSVGLSLNFFSGFYMSGTLAGNTYLVVALAFAVCLFVSIGFYNKKTLLAMSGFLFTIALLTVVFALKNNLVSFSGENDNGNFLFFVITILTSIAVSALSRITAGTIFVFSIGAFVCACLAFLKYPVSEIGYIMFTFSAGVLILYRVYTTSLSKAENGTYNSGKYSLQAMIVSLITLALSVVLFAFVIVPLSPPTRELKLITKLKSFEILDVVGISSKTEIQNNTVFSDNLNEQKNTSKNPDETKKQNEKNSEKNDTKAEKDHKSEDLIFAKKISYFSESKIKYLLVSVPFLLVGIAIAAKLYLRKKAYENAINKPNTDAAISLYLIFVKKFRRAGIVHTEYETYGEYSKKIEKDVEIFSVRDISFAVLTDIYEKVLYGYKEVSNDELKNFKVFYSMFYKNMREKLGHVKYILKFLTI